MYVWLISNTVNYGSYTCLGLEFNGTLISSNVICLMCNYGGTHALQSLFAYKPVFFVCVGKQESNKRN